MIIGLKKKRIANEKIACSEVRAGFRVGWGGEGTGKREPHGVYVGISRKCERHVRMSASDDRTGA